MARFLARTITGLALLAATGLGFAGTPPAALAAGKILVLGDSLSAGYGVDTAQAWPARLQARLQAARLPYAVVNASVSGQTSAGGQALLGPLLRQHRPVLVLLELGANDALRGQDLAATSATLERSARDCRAAGAQVLLLGTELPPNYGPRYRDALRRMYAQVAQRTGAALMPFLLGGIAQDAGNFQPDGLHPTAVGLVQVERDVWAAITRHYALAPPGPVP